jgi:hypothetical protein
VEPRDHKVKDLSISARQPWKFRALLEREYRPFGTKTARARLLGVYGPEWVHLIEERDDRGYYVATGLEINLNDGITEVSLVEVPHTLK